MPTPSDVQASSHGLSSSCGPKRLQRTRSTEVLRHRHSIRLEDTEAPASVQHREGTAQVLQGCGVWTAPGGVIRRLGGAGIPVSDSFGTAALEKQELPLGAAGSVQHWGQQPHGVCSSRVHARLKWPSPKSLRTAGQEQALRSSRPRAVSRQHPCSHSTALQQRGRLSSRIGPCLRAAPVQNQRSPAGHLARCGAGAFREAVESRGGGDTEATQNYQNLGA